MTRYTATCTTCGKLGTFRVLCDAEQAAARHEQKHTALGVTYYHPVVLDTAHTTTVEEAV
jgi:hypothetical protein